MKIAGAFLTRHRNLILFALLLTTLCVSSAENQRRLSADHSSTAIPVIKTTAPSAAVSTYISERDAAYQRDTAALSALCTQENLEAKTRASAAERLQTLIANREAQQALEDALSSTSLAPCAAVVSGGSVTIVTQKADITEQDAALVITLAAAHAGVKAENVRILPTE